MFDSNNTPILIEGKSLQNHIVMAFPYDKPLSDLQGKLQNYGRFIGNAVFSYGRDYGHPSGFEDEIKSALACRNIYPLYKRFSLTDGGSVLKHLCTLLWFEFERSNDYLDNKNKYESQYRYQDVNSMIELIKNHGFDYKFCSVKTARTSKEKKMKEIKNKIFKL